MPSRAQLGQRLARLEQQIAKRERAAHYERLAALGAEGFPGLKYDPHFTPAEKRQVLETLIGAGWLAHRSSNEREMAFKLQLLSAIYPDMSATEMMALYEPHAEEATHEPTAEPSAEPTEQPVAS